MSNYMGPERRNKTMHEKSVDRELGELTAMVKILTQKVDNLSSEFRESKILAEAQSAKDYKYLDDKIGLVDKRVSTIEKDHDKSTPWGKFKAKIFDVATGTIAIGIVGFVFYLVMQYIEKAKV